MFWPSDWLKIMNNFIKYNSIKIQFAQKSIEKY